MTVGPDNMHFDLAGGIAPEHRTILHQHHARPLARRGQRGTEARHAATRHQKIGFQGMLFHKNHSRSRRLMPANWPLVKPLTKSVSKR